MSATDTPTMMAAGDKSYEEVRKAWHAAHVRPLWENPVAHKSRDGGPKPHLWQWRQLRPFIDDAMKVTSPAAVERRVLSLIDPESEQPGRRHRRPTYRRPCRSCCRANPRGRTATP